MSRPAVTVVMPFAGTAAEARAALSTLHALRTRTGDQLILADNTGTAGGDERVEVVAAPGERSAAHARNAGARRARNEWILFLDADCLAPATLLDDFFSTAPAAAAGAVAGEVAAADPGVSAAERYAASKSFLSARSHLAHPYRPRAAAANLLVRRAAFEQIGGFYEGLRAGEDTDFTWRLQAAGWVLEARPAALVEHRYRTSLRDLRRQWRGYAAGRAWLARRYDDFLPEPAAARAAKRLARRRPRATRAGAARPRKPLTPADRWLFLAIDTVLAADELTGLALSNRPSRPAAPPVEVVLVADRFPAAGDPLADFASSLERARVEAVARPDSVDSQALARLRVDYREDDGIATRVRALAALVARHPARAVRDLIAHHGQRPSLLAIAPAVRRLEREPPGAAVHALGGEQAHRVADRIAALTGRRRAGR